MKNLPFDTTQIATSFSRAAASYDAAAVLQREVGQRLLERLDLSALQPTHILDLGTGTGFIARQLTQRYKQAHVIAMDIAYGMLQYAQQQNSKNTDFICADANYIPLANNSIDLIVSNLTIHWCADLAAVFAELRRVLKPGGLLLFSTLGPDTLHELRTSWASIDQQTHVHSFIDMHNVGDELVQAKFIEPVMDMENITLTYRDMLRLMRDLKNLGAHNLASTRPRGLTPKSHLQKLSLAYENFRDTAGLYPATYEVIYGQAWGPPPMTSTAPNEAGEVFIPLNTINKPRTKK